MSETFGDSGIPRYLQIADLLRGRLARGQWNLGDRLPSLEALAQEFGVARLTVRQAVERLTRDGLLSPQQGRGTFVTAQPAPPRWLRVRMTLDELAESYRDTQPQILNFDEAIADAPLEPEDGTPAPRYVFMRRRHSQDGVAYCLINIYLDHAIFVRHPERFRNETVIPILVRMKQRVVAHARQVMTVGTADIEVARHLGVPLNAPVAHVRRVFTDAQRRVTYLGEVTYRGDLVRLDMDLMP